MGRFDRETGTGGVPESLGSATSELRATVEEKVREIVEAAEARAHEIEDQALAQALEIEQDSEQKARQRFQSSTQQTEQMIAAIDAFEREVKEALRTLRTTGEALAIELGAPPPATAEEAPPEAAAPEPPPVEAPAPEPLAGDESHAEVTLAPTQEAEPAAPEDAREGVRRRILDLFLAGEPRVEAERMLGRIEDGGRYIDLLDEVYEGRTETQQGSSSRRRGGRRRRRPGSAE